MLTPSLNMQIENNNKNNILTIVHEMDRACQQKVEVPVLMHPTVLLKAWISVYLEEREGLLR